MNARPVELSSRPGRIFWYSGESYQRLNAALSANSKMTMRFGSGPPSISHTHQDWQNIGSSPATNACTTNNSFFASRSPIVEAAPDDRNGAL